MTQNKMQAIRYHQFGGPEVLQLEQVEIPAPQVGEVLIRVHAAGVLPIEWKLRQGGMPIPIKLPHIPGSALAGIVEEVGAGVTAFRKGQAVFGRSANGAYAEYTTAAAASLALKPESLSFEEAATLSGGATTAWQALIHDGELKAGERVLIHGAAGGVGLYAVQFAKWKGAEVIGTAGPANLDFIHSLGADTAIDYSTTPFEQVAEEIDLILDTIGGDTLARSWSVLKRGGTVVSLVGQPSPEKADTFGVWAIKPARLASSKDLEDIAKLIEEGYVKAFTGPVFSLQDARLAHEQSQQGHGRGRIVLRM